MEQSVEERLNKYMISMKKANKKYVETHKELINQRRRKYYREKQATDEVFKEKKRLYAKALYHKKKNQNLKSENENKIENEIN